MNDTLTALITRDFPGYPQAPFGPDTAFPELKRLPYALQPGESNPVYTSVRELLASLGLDAERRGTPDWNPFASLVSKGERVVIKPNMVIDNHPLGAEGTEAMLTHASVVRPLIDYVLLATGGDVHITICDVPLQEAVWDKLIAANGMRSLAEFYTAQGIDVKLLDLRREISLRNDAGVIVKRLRAERDPDGYAVIDLGTKSFLYEIRDDSSRLEITNYGTGTVSKHHRGEKNEYCIAQTVLNADLFINVPKLKTHRKAGMTGAMKNLIGINGEKSWIAHHRRGIDECSTYDFAAHFKWKLSYYLKVYAPVWVTTLFYRLYRVLFLKGKTIREHGMREGGIDMEGNWHGNDTVWRTILDLNNILRFAGKDGRLYDTPRRKTLIVVDGVIGMEKEGPLDGIPKHSSILLGGFHPVAVDFLASHVMGFDPEKVPAVRNGFRENFFSLTPFGPGEIQVNGNTDWRGIDLGFTPSRGWAGHLERKRD